MKVSHGSPNGYTTLRSGDGVKQKVARLMYSQDDAVTDFPAQMQAPLMYCAPSACDSEPYISAEACKSQLGERTFNILRQAMLQQQEVFIEQLWDLHRLTRTQHRRAALLPTASAAQQVDPSIDVFSRSVQERIRNETMHEISKLPTIPTSLRHTFVAKPAENDKCAQAPLPCTADIVQMSPGAISSCAPGHADQDKGPSVSASQNPVPAAGNTGPLFAGLNGEVAYPYSHLPTSGPAGFSFADNASANPFSWASGSPHVAGSAFSTSLGVHGQPAVCANPQYIAGLQQHGGLRVTSMQQLPSVVNDGDVRGASSAAKLLSNPSKDNSMAPAKQSQVDVSSLLGMMAPGLQPAPDIHQQWVQRNSRTGVSVNPHAISPVNLSLQKVMDVPVPDIKPWNTLDHVRPDEHRFFRPVRTASFIDRGHSFCCPVQSTNEQTMSHSSASVWSANSLFMPAALQVPALVQHQLAAEGAREGKQFVGLPSAAAMILPEALGANDTTPTASHLTRAGLVDKDLPKKGPGTCHTDESAASILMSLKGS